MIFDNMGKIGPTLSFINEVVDNSSPANASYQVGVIAKQSDGTDKASNSRKSL